MEDCWNPDLIIQAENALDHLNQLKDKDWFNRCNRVFVFCKDSLYSKVEETFHRLW